MSERHFPRGRQTTDGALGHAITIQLGAGKEFVRERVAARLRAGQRGRATIAEVLRDALRLYFALRPAFADEIRYGTEPLDVELRARKKEAKHGRT